MSITLFRGAILAIGGSATIITVKLYIETKDNGKPGLKCLSPNAPSLLARYSDVLTTKTLNPDSTPGIYIIPINRDMDLVQDPLFLACVVVLLILTEVFWYIKAYVE